MANPKVGDPITPKERELMRMIEGGATLRQCEIELKIINAKNILSRIFYKIPKEELLKKHPKLLKAMEGAKNAMTEVKHLLPKGIAEAIERRLKAKSMPSEAVPYQPTEKEVIRLLEQKLWLALQYLDDFALAAASAKDVASTVDLLIENIQLLKGKPTSIMSHSERRQINELIPLLLDEAKRRGVMLEGESHRVQ